MFHHALHEVFVFLLVLVRCTGIERDHWQQLLSAREHCFLDNQAQLFVARPYRVATTIGGPGAQHKIHDFMPEVLRIADASRFLDFFQLVVEGVVVENFAGFRVAVLLILNP